MHILMLTSEFYPIVGGAEKQAERLSAQLANRNHKITIITKWHKGLMKKESYKNFNIQRIKVSNIKRLIPYIYMLKVLWFLLQNSKKVDVIHAHTISAAGLSAAIGSMLFNIPSIVKIPGGNKEGSLIKRLAKTRVGKIKLRILKRHIDKFISISKAINTDLKKMRFHENKIVSIPNGIDIKAFKPKQADVVNKNNIIYVGRLEYVKGIDFLIKSWTQLDSSIKENKHLTILGEGSIDIETRLNSEINWLGNVDNVIDYLNEAEYYVLPSRYEGVSNSLLEALANGKIVIASNVGGNPDLIVNQKNGFLFESENFDSFKEALKLAFSLSKNEKSDIKLNAIKTVTHKYSICEITDRYLTLYKQLVKK